MTEIERIKEENNAVLAAIYINTANTDNPEDLIASQLSKIHNYATTNNIIITDTYIDRDDTDTERTRLLDDIEENLFNIILVYNQVLHSGVEIENLGYYSTTQYREAYGAETVIIDVGKIQQN